MHVGEEGSDPVYAAAPILVIHVARPKLPLLLEELMVFGSLERFCPIRPGKVSTSVE